MGCSRYYIITRTISASSHIIRIFNVKKKIKLNMTLLTWPSPVCTCTVCQKFFTRFTTFVKFWQSPRDPLSNPKQIFRLATDKTGRPLRKYLLCPFYGLYSFSSNRRKLPITSRCSISKETQKIKTPKEEKLPTFQLECHH